MSTDSVNETATTTVSEHLTARCKWFNNKAGYGFLTVCGGERDGQDIFVHHSAVKVNEDPAFSAILVAEVDRVTVGALSSLVIVIVTD